MNAVANGSPAGQRSPPSEPESSSVAVAQRLISLQEKLVDAVTSSNEELLRQQDQLMMLLLSPASQVVETFDDDPDQPRTHLDGSPVR